MTKLLCQISFFFVCVFSVRLKTCNNFSHIGMCSKTGAVNRVAEAKAET